MRAIHINPWAKTVREVELDDDGECITYKAVRLAVFNGRQYALGHIEKVALNPGVDAWVDEEAFSVPWLEQRFFALRAPGAPRAARQFAGHVVLAGHDGWSGCVGLSPAISVAMVLECVQWLDAREVVAEAEAHC